MGCSLLALDRSIEKEASEKGKTFQLGILQKVIAPGHVKKKKKSIE